jgi:hypothetical protein
MSFRYRENGKSFFRKTKFRKCEISDFERVNFKLKDQDIENYKLRFCPDIKEEDKKWMVVHNGYTNY